jgi:hypothetical protein
MLTPRLAVYALAAGLSSVSAADCPRPTLQKVASAYVDSVTRTGLTLDLASPFTYTENFRAADVKTGALSKPIKISHSRVLLDSPGCAIYVEIIAPGTKPQYHIGSQIHVDGSGKASKIEAVINSDLPNSGSWVFNATRTLAYIQKEDKEGGRGVIAAEKRDSREVLKRAADAYFDLFSGGKAANVPFAPGCTRVEGGFSKAIPCSAGIPSSGGKNMMLDRRYVIDETVGSVEVMLKFMGSSPDTHDFRLEGGKIRYVHAITVLGGGGGGKGAKSAKAGSGSPKGI